MPYSKDTWTLGQQVDYGVTAALAGMSHVAKYGREWLYNFYRVHRDWVNYDKGPFAFVVPATQRDPFATYEMLDILKFGDVEIHQRHGAVHAPTASSTPAGSWVIKTAQPYGAFAKTMLEKQNYPDLRLFPGGPPEPPYDVTGHTLWMLMGVTVDAVDKPFDAPLELLKTVAPVAATGAGAAEGRVSRSAPNRTASSRWSPSCRRPTCRSFRAGEERSKPSGADVRAGHVRDSADAGGAEDRRERGERSSACRCAGADRAPAVDGFRLKPNTQVGLWKGANNMPGGWMMWMLEQYGINHEIVKAQDFAGDLNAKYDVILLPSGTTKARIVNGLDPKRNDPAEWSWAFGVGEEGWKKLRAFVENGGTLLAIGIGGRDRARAARPADREGAARSAARASAPAARQPPRRRRRRQRVDRALRDAFSSPARLMQMLRDRVADPENPVLLPGLAAAERVRPEPPGRVGHAGGVAGVLRERSGVSPASGIRHRDARSCRAIRARTSCRAAGCSARSTCATRRTSSRSGSARATS